MLGSRDPNGVRSGRDSRASNLSAMSRATNKAPGEAGGSAPKDPLSSTGVLNMLRTSTEMGNLGGTLGDGIGQAPRASQRRGASSRLSTASSMSNQSGYANNRIHQQRPPSSSGARHSMTHESRPSKRDERHSTRSLSITNAMPHPERRLSNNRSLTSLRNEEADQRPRSPLAYPTRLRHAGYGSASSTWSDPPGTYPRRAQTPINQGPANYHAHVRRRLPSDASLGHQERGVPRMLRRPSRGPSPAYYQMPNGDIPPVPPLPQHYQQYHTALEHTRMLHRSVQGSGSSASTNLRTDSDTPSSDPALPPTPRDGMSMNMLGQLPINRMMRGTNPRSSPMYYDYTEQFEAEDFVEPGTEPVPGFIRQIKTVAEEPDDIVPPSSTGASSVNQNGNVRPFEGREIAELEASPVGRRITRELVQSRLEMTSTTGGLTSLASSAIMKDKAKTDGIHDCQEQSSTDCIADETSGSAMLPTGRSDNRHSILSQTGSSVLESSTLEFAVKCSIPAMTGTSPDHQFGANPMTESASPSSPEKNTDDGMSELIGGYQHTESKQEGDIVQPSEALRKNESDLANPLERISRHVQNSSDEQSFKSCTDVPEPVSPGSGNIQQSRPKEKVGRTSPAPQPSIEDADARSIQTSKDIRTPSRARSMPLSQLPLAVQDAGLQPSGSSAAGMPLASPRRTTLKTVSTSLSMSFTNKFRKSSKASIKQTSVSTTDSSSTLGTPQQPPQVPPRDSSASLEAQRHTGVSKFLMFRGKAARLSRGKKTAPVVDTGPRNSIEDTTSRPVHQHHGSSRSIDQPQRAPDVVRTSDAAPTDQDNIAERHVPTPPGEQLTPTHDLRVNRVVIPALHHHSFSTPTTGVPQPSSVYSPQDVSVKGRVHSSPAGVPTSPEGNQRDSQSTTHLSWIGSRRPLGTTYASASEPRLALPSVQEDTTTDLRLSGYRYNPPQRYLHDVKEDSHEDSSLNTSASNLRNSHFRFPHGSGLGMRTSADDAMAILGKSSMGSRCGSVLEDVLNLPSLEFSHGNLFDRFKDALVDARFSRSSGRTQLGSPGGAEQGSPHDCDSAERDCRQSPGPVKGVVEVEGEKELTGATDPARLERTRSPKLLIEELERMRIPSVAQLTQRFTELLPSLSLAENRELGGADRHGEFPEEEEMMEHALEEIHHVHPPSQKRSSARLRPVRGASGLVIMEDDVFEEIVSQERGGKMCGDQCVQELEFGTGRGEAGPRAKDKGKATTRTPVRQLSVVAELQTPSPAVLRSEHHDTSSDRFTRRSVESSLSLTRSPRSFVSTPAATDTRPWNFDKNYSWATTTKPSVDISLPPPAAVRQSPRAGPSHLRNTLSDATTSTFASSRTPTTSPPGDASGSNAYRQTRLSILGRSGDQAHAVGERYPTSALTPPTAIFRDHLSSCDTSDDDDFTTTRKANRLTLRKRFSSAARSNTLIHTTPRATRSKANPAQLASPASVHESSTSTLQDRAGEVRAFTSNRHRIVDSIKRWWHKGGRLIRTISRRNSHHRNHDVHSARD